jgi:hypothetical protein
MKALGANAGDFILVDVFVTVLENNEHRAVSALDELVERRLVLCSSHKDAFAMTKAGARYRTLV